MLSLNSILRHLLLLQQLPIDRLHPHQHLVQKEQHLHLEERDLLLAIGQSIHAWWIGWILRAWEYRIHSIDCGTTPPGRRGSDWRGHGAEKGEQQSSTGWAAQDSSAMNTSMVPSQDRAVAYIRLYLVELIKLWRNELHKPHVTNPL